MKTLKIEVANLEIYKNVKLSQQIFKILQEMKEVQIAVIDTQNENRYNNTAEELIDVIQESYGALCVLERTGLINIEAANRKHVDKLKRRFNE